MKKVIFIIAFALCFASSATMYAQHEKEEVKLNQKIDSIKDIESGLKKQEKSIKKEIHELKSQDVSDLIKEQFKRDFLNVEDVRWKHLNYGDEAIFVNNGVVTKAYYNNSDTFDLMGTIVNKTFADLPKRAQEKIDKKYGEYERVLVIFYDDNDYNDANILLYDEEISEPDTYFAELRKDNKTIVLGFSEDGDLVFEKDLKE